MWTILWIAKTKCVEGFSSLEWFFYFDFFDSYLKKTNLLRIPRFSAWHSETWEDSVSSDFFKICIYSYTQNHPEAITQSGSCLSKAKNKDFRSRKIQMQRNILSALPDFKKINGTSSVKCESKFEIAVSTFAA